MEPAAVNEALRILFSLQGGNDEEHITKKVTHRPIRSHDAASSSTY